MRILLPNIFTSDESTAKRCVWVYRASLSLAIEREASRAEQSRAQHSTAQQSYVKLEAISQLPPLPPARARRALPSSTQRSESTSTSTAEHCRAPVRATHYSHYPPAPRPESESASVPPIQSHPVAHGLDEANQLLVTPPARPRPVEQHLRSSHAVPRAVIGLAGLPACLLACLLAGLRACVLAPAATAAAAPSSPQQQPTRPADRRDLHAGVLAAVPRACRLELP